MKFSERPPSTQWLPLTYRGEPFAEVWFKPEGNPLGLTFRIPRESFEIAGVRERLTTENLLNTVGVATQEVESWRQGETSYAGMDGSNPELRRPVEPPAPEWSHLELEVRLAPAPNVSELAEGGEAAAVTPEWQDLEARWNAILAVEAGIDALRVTMEGVRVELEAAWSKALSPEDKLNALRADVAQWQKAKNRIHHALPKLREFVHRATWAAGTPERKKLGEFFDSRAAGAPLPEPAGLSEQLEYLLKDRQILSSQGVTVHQECKTILSEIQGALRTLQINAASNARQKRDMGRAGGKFFKDVRRWSMGKG